jgi:uncharacterized surface protein with fasciclin (FAS1) repeats
VCAGLLWFLGGTGLARPGEGATERPPAQPAERSAALTPSSDPTKSAAAPSEPAREAADAKASSASAGGDKDAPTSQAAGPVPSPAPNQAPSQAKTDGGPAADSGASVESADVVRALERRGLLTLVKALQAAGLDRTLHGPGPFTVFAPTESAWKKLSGDKLTALLHDRSRLRTILATHVLKGRVLGKTVVILKNALMMSGAIIPIDGSHGLHQTRIQGSLLVGPDVVCKNGIIHMIDGVLSPERTNKAAASLTDDAEGAEPAHAVAATAASTAAPAAKGAPSTRGSGSRRSSRSRR